MVKFGVNQRSTGDAHESSHVVFAKLVAEDYIDWRRHLFLEKISSVFHVDCKAEHLTMGLYVAR